MTEVFRVVKLASGNPVRAYKTNSGEIGAEMERDDYIAALAEEFGNPLLVLTKKQFIEKLLKAADMLQMRMQQTTSSVAGIKITQNN